MHTEKINLFLYQWNSGKVIQLGWSSSEDLLCIQDDGVILVYDIFGNFKRTFSMGQVVWNFFIYIRPLIVAF